MTEPLDQLYQLLPGVYRDRDAPLGEPLRALLRVITEQVQIVESDIAQLYENWFIETCQDWAVPYIGELIGYQFGYELESTRDPTTATGRRRQHALTPRREVANTIRYHRRKGTLALLEELARDVAGWPARAVEFSPLLGLAQALGHLRPNQGRLLDLRDGTVLERLGGPFEAAAHTVDIRRPGAGRSRGWFNIPSVGLFVWRLKVYSITRAPAYCLEEVGAHCFTFSVLGNDTQLYTHPDPEPEPAHIADELNLPVPITRRALEARLLDYYGLPKSLHVWVGQAQQPTPRGQSPVITLQPVPPDQVVVADLRDWAYRPRRGQVAIDPVRGRIAFPPTAAPTWGVWVSYYYGFPADIGGGEYDRPLTQPARCTVVAPPPPPPRGHRRAANPPPAPEPPTAPDETPEPPPCLIYPVGEGQGEFVRIADALAQWHRDQPRHAIVEIRNSGAYVEQITIELNENQHLQIRAANRTRPVIRLLNWQTARPDALTVTGAPGSCLTLDGLLITGREVRVAGEMAGVTIRHCTLVPGWGLENNCAPWRPNEPSLSLVDTNARVVIEHSILGTIQVIHDEVRREPMTIQLSDSILDATSPDREALGTAGPPLAHAVLTITRCTVIGQVLTHAIDLAENSIFAGWVRVARRQRGCMRFCYVQPGSRTPRRHHCQPDEAVGDRTGVEREQVALRVRPQFNSVRYGTPTYCQLAETCPTAITRGADDESEMGVYHDLYQPQREAALRTRLAEYTPAGAEAGLIFAS